MDRAKVEGRPNQAQVDRSSYVRREMLVFPHAKINLGLQVLRLRVDGYRDIASVLVPVPLCDALEVIVDPALGNGELVFTRSGRDVPGDPGQDLCVKAHALLKKRHRLTGARMHLHKVIPIGAGLGGGSSDGAHALKLLNDVFHLEETDAELHGMASNLGSDCAFFLRNGPHLAEGRGERLSPLPLKLRGWWLMLINPGLHVSTAEVYAHTAVTPEAESLVDVLSDLGPEMWSNRVVNVMEDFVFEAYPAVALVKELILGAGAAYAAMSGSGSSVFGLFREKPVLPVMPAGYSGWILPL